MAKLSAISADSFGNRFDTALGLPPRRNDPGTRADRETALRWVNLQNRDVPGGWVDNVWQQADSFHSGVYIAVNTIMTAISGASVVAMRKRPQEMMARKSVSSASSAEESEWSPLESGHEISKLFADPNEVQTTSDFLSEYMLCRGLFGEGIIYAPPGRDKKPAELWNLRKNYTSQTGGISPEYPRGSIWYNTPAPMLWGVGGPGLGLRIPREHLVFQRRPHPRFPWDGYSPLAGGGKMVDFLNSVIDSRQIAMERGLSLAAIIGMAGATQDQLIEADARMREKYTGKNRGQPWAVVDGERVSATALSIKPDEMAFGENYTHAVAAVLALFGVPAVCAFLADADYSGFYAAARAWREGNLSSEVKTIGDTLTKHLIRPNWGDEYKVVVKLPPLMDPEQKERGWQTLTAASSAVTYTVNEIRASYDMNAIDGGDVTPAEFNAKLQKANQPQSAGQPAGQMAGQATGNPDYQGNDAGQMTGQNDPLAQLLAGVGDPNAEPAAPGDVENPDVGSASAGSLPGAVRKAIKFHKPENYDKVKDLPEGRELWVGQNDWESGTTWGWVQKKESGRDGNPIAFINVSHDDCPGCRGELDADYTGDAKKCNAHGRRKIDEWLKGLKKGGADAVRKGVDLEAIFDRLVREVCA